MQNLLPFSSKSTHQYCKSLLMGERTEHLYAIALDNKCVILGAREISEGTLTEVNAYPRKIIKTALNYNANAIILCHNHPGRANQPSKADIESTRKIKFLLNTLGIGMLDHIIVCGSNTYSMALHRDIGDEEQAKVSKKTEGRQKEEGREKEKSRLIEKTRSSLRTAGLFFLSNSLLMLPGFPDPAGRLPPRRPHESARPAVKNGRIRRC